MARITRKTKRYPSDMTEEEWERIAPLMPESGRTGRPSEMEGSKNRQLMCLAGNFWLLAI